MPPTLPIPFLRKVAGFGMLLSVTLVAGCRHVVSEAPAKPGPPIVAEGEIELESADIECAALITALETYGTCPNLEDGDREWTQAAIEAAQDSFAAGKKAAPDEPSLHAIAMACHRAAASMQAATERCLAGKRPRVD